MQSFNLQRFAGEKTERATPRRRMEARNEGRFPRSQDLTSSMGLVAGLVAFKVFGPALWNKWQTMMAYELANSNRPLLTDRGLQALLTGQLWLLINMLTPILVVVLLVGTLTAFAQVGPVFLPKHLLPDISRISPISGFQRMFSLKSGIEALKSTLKLVVVGVIAYSSIRGAASKLQIMSTSSISQIPALVGQLAFQIAIEIAILMLVLSILDFVYQRFDFERSIRMSRQEIKDEQKQQEGNPQIKSKIRQRGRALAMRRMMQDVRKADVVVTNPTHFAVALRYDSRSMNAPIVVAKGQDEVARRIRETAQDAAIPLVENKPLAQTLYKTVEIGASVPNDLYQAVAEILAYVYRLKSANAKR